MHRLNYILWLQDVMDAKADPLQDDTAASIRGIDMYELF